MSAIFEISEATLIGRAAELTQIRETLDSVTDGRSQLLVISGEPGIGKTRLLQELAVEAQLRGYRVFSGRGTELETETPFAPLIEALDNELALSEPETLKELRQRLPDLLGVFPSLGRRDPASAGSGSERFRHHRAVRELLQELAVVMPLLLIIDDIHWADAASIETIAHLLRHPPDAPVLVALAHRTANPPALLSAVLDAAVREAHVSELRLATFTEEEAAALLASAPEQTRGQIFRESGGNPFYIEQLMRAMSGWHPSQPESERSGFEIPRAVAGAISQELRQLEADAARMLEGAAVVGDPFDPMLACEAGDVDPDRALELLDELAARDLIRASAVGAGTFRFRHPLVRRAVYDSLAPGKRIAMHRRAANALEEFQAPTLAIAHHLSISARRGDRHAITVLASAAAEVAAAAPASAVGWLRVALSLLPEGPSPERLALLSSLAESQTSAGSLPDAHATLLEIVDTLSDQGGAPWTQAVAGLASVELALGRQAGMRDRLASALVAIPEQQAAAGTPLLIVSALDAAFEGDFAGAERSASTAVSLSEGMPVPQIVSRALLALVLQLQGDGRIAIAEAHLREAHTEFERLNDDELHGHLEVPWMLGMTEFQLEHFEDSVRHLQRGVDLARSTADGQHLAQTRTFLAYGLLHLGRMEEARRVAEEALDAGRLLRAAAYSAWATVVAATVWSLDDRRRALDLAAEAEAMLGDLDQNMVFDTTHGHIGMICADAGDHDGCLRHMQLAGAPDFTRFGDPTRRAMWIEALTRSSLALGKHEEAAAWAARGEQLAHGLALPTAEGAAQRALALVALEAGDPGTAAELSLSAAAKADGRRARIEAGRSRIVAGRALVAAGQRARGLDLLQETRSDLAECGAQRLAQEAGRALRTFGVNVPAPVARRSGDGGTIVLSKREREVATLVASGNSNPQIAQALYLSPKTVEGHMSRIFAKLEISSRAELAARVASASV